MPASEPSTSAALSGSAALPRWIPPVLILASLHVAMGLAGVVVEPSDDLLATPIRVAHMLAFGLCGGFLTLLARPEPRAAYLGGVLLGVAGAYARFPSGRLVAALPEPASQLAAGVAALPADVFVPAFLWRFAAEFPRVTPTHPRERAERAAVHLATATAAILFGVNVALFLGGERAATWRPWLSAAAPSSLYWIAVYGLTLSGFGYLALKARRALADERRRVRLFLGALVGPGIPASLYIVGTALSADLLSFLKRPSVDAVVTPAIQLLLLALPVGVTYAVLIDRVLDVRPVLRKALQYALARSTLAMVTALPFVAFAWYLWGLRQEPIARVLAMPRSLVLVASAGLGLVLLRWRDRALAVVDRTFFREGYDSHRLLAEFTDRARAADDAAHLAVLVRETLANALHAERVALLVSAAGSRLRDPEAKLRPLSTRTPLVRELVARREPCEIDLERRSSDGWERLPESDRRWLADADARLVVLLVDSGGRARGLLTLSGKQSEQHYSSRDRLFVAAVAAAGGLALENLAMRHRRDPAFAHAPSEEVDEPALECPGCGLVAAPPLDHCRACDATPVAASIPRLLLGKFRVEQRIGAGGMGVVYRAHDVSLDRPVALKTLPRVSPERSLGLRREARSMAAVMHPNLALVFGIESWQAVPVLICELLVGGTLADLLDRGRLTPAATVRLGRALCEALAQLHDARLLHRDIKPSNIGYTGEGMPKLLDFGLAQLVGRALEGGERVRDGRPGSVAPARPDWRSTRATDGMIGTPLYLSPGALWGREPEPSFDLWSLALVLYECVAGRHPMERETWADTVDSIVQGRAEDVRAFAPECPASLAELLSDALGRDPARRPASARELRGRLDRIDI